MLSRLRPGETAFWPCASRTLRFGVLLGLVSILVAGCGTTTPDHGLGAPHSPGSAGQATSVKYQLLTHCGIGEAQVGGKYYEAVTPLNDGNGNPPAGWDNPFQAGVMTVTSAKTALFTDHRGHRVEFRVREGATGWKMLCS